jgi:hypothetical protein
MSFLECKVAENICMLMPQLNETKDKKVRFLLLIVEFFFRLKSVDQELKKRLVREELI